MGRISIAPFMTAEGTFVSCKGKVSLISAWELQSLCHISWYSVEHTQFCIGCYCLHEEGRGRKALFCFSFLKSNPVFFKETFWNNSLNRLKIWKKLVHILHVEIIIISASTYHCWYCRLLIFFAQSAELIVVKLWYIKLELMLLFISRTFMFPWTVKECLPALSSKQSYFSFFHIKWSIVLSKSSPSWDFL